MIAITVAVCLALLLTAGAGLVMVVWRDAGAARPVDRAGSPAVSAPTRSAATQSGPTRSAAGRTGPGGEMDKSTRWASVGEAAMTLPEPPYVIHPDPLRLEGVLDVAFMAEAVVHRRSQGSRSWSATVALASLSDSLSPDADLASRGSAAVDRLAEHMYGEHPGSVSRLTTTEHDVDGHDGVLVRAKVAYDVERLPSRYDAVTAVVVRLGDGTVVAAISSVPNDAGEEVTRLAAASLASLTISG